MTATTPNMQPYQYPDDIPASYYNRLNCYQRGIAVHRAQQEPTSVVRANAKQSAQRSAISRSGAASTI